jgi:hypothetical protein
MLKELRVYTSAIDADAHSKDVMFYSRRANGPYYRWRYEKDLGQWRGSRMQLRELAQRDLSVASWKDVPSSLQARLDEHYLD